MVSAILTATILSVVTLLCGAAVWGILNPYRHKQELWMHPLLVPAAMLTVLLWYVFILYIT